MDLLIWYGTLGNMNVVSLTDLKSQILRSQKQVTSNVIDTDYIKPNPLPHPLSLNNG